MGTVKININKIRPEAVIPTKRDEDGCFDIYAAFDEESLLIAPHDTVLVPTGIRTNFDKKYRIILKERGTNAKVKLMVQAGVIDSGYTGEWFVALYNGNDIPVIIEKKQLDIILGKNEIIFPYHKAIAQASVEIVPNSEFVLMSDEDFDNIKTERGNRKLGSSGK